jgi:hypothetical protein
MTTFSSASEKAGVRATKYFLIFFFFFFLQLMAILGEWIYDQWKAKSIEKRLKGKDLITIGQSRQGWSIGRRRISVRSSADPVF